ncbi:MAG: hypothetical protein GX096_03640 [Clostridiales bacterium]|nr:hypothetical protein [Clostridiales bacterium]
MKTIYILLTKTSTMISKMIRAVTHDEYTHVSIALDKELHELYSFARIHSCTPLPAGLVQENLQTEVYARNGKSKCALYQMIVTDEQFDFIQTTIRSMMDLKDEYHYSVLGLLLCKLDFVHDRHSHMFCSQFVSKLLEDSGAVTLPKPSSLMHPIDFTRITKLHCCYRGTIHGCIAWHEHSDDVPRLSSTSFAR